MTEESVKNSVVKYLSRKEWRTNLYFDSLRERGVDIKIRYNRYCAVPLGGWRMAKSL